MRRTKRPVSTLVSGTLACFFLLVLPLAALAQGGRLDPTFSTDGKVRTNFAPGDDDALAVALQADGKIVVAGQAGGFHSKFALARYRVGGRLDKTFGGDGRVVTNLTRFTDLAFDVVIQSDGKIVAGGTADFQKFALARYNPDGSLDTSFSGNGKVTTEAAEGLNVVTGLAVQADGKIVAAGTAGGQVGNRFAIARYNTDGSLDTSFEGDGIVKTNITGRPDWADAVRLQQDGKIVVAGEANSFCCDSRFALVRYLADGSLDSTFGDNGIETTNFTSGHAGEDAAFALGIQADGKIVAAGQAGEPRVGGRLGVARYNGDGTLDTSFGGDGKVRTNLSRGVDLADDLEMQADGKVVVGGWANYRGDDSTFALVRYDPDGSRDLTFSGDGKVRTDFTSGRDGAAALVIQLDGNIVAAGQAGGRHPTWALARYRGA